jgi:hypothetical protein
VSRDWAAWHAAYDEADSALERRLRVVRQVIGDWLHAHPGPVRVVSACAGEGRDLLGVLAERAAAGDDPARVTARLVELDPRNAAAARAAAAPFPGVTVEEADAGVVGAYAGAVPAGLVLLCGIFGNVPDADVHRTVAAAPRLCAPGATVVWTRHRRAPDLTVQVRRWFGAAGFSEVAFTSPADGSWAVGLHRFDGEPAELQTGQRLFTFNR